MSALFWRDARDEQDALYVLLLRRNSEQRAEAGGVDPIVYGETPCRALWEADPNTLTDILTDTNYQINIAQASSARDRRELR